MGDSLKTLPALSSLPRLSATLASAPSCMRWAGAVVAHWQSSQLPVAHPDTCAPPWLWLRFPCTHCEPAQRPHWHTQWVPTRTPPDPHVEVAGSAEGSGSLTAATSAPARDRTATVTHGLNVNMSPSNPGVKFAVWVVCGLGCAHPEHVFLLFGHAPAVGVGIWWQGWNCDGWLGFTVG